MPKRCATDADISTAARKTRRCEHGRVRYTCKDCGGSAICEHGRQRPQCKDCGGSAICDHGRQRPKCKECGGSAICEHGRERYGCKECGGSAICEHGRQRPKCKECGGSAICEHGRVRYGCKECGGSAICDHGRQRPKCKECGGSGICEHGRVRSTCKECGGSGICEHGRMRYGCKECGGSGICEHGRVRSTCKECGGSAVCEHAKQRRVCFECGGSGICKAHRTTLCGTIGNRKYKGWCARCFMHLHPDQPVARNYKTKEAAVVEHVKAALPGRDWVWDKRVEDGCSRRRPDLRVDLGYQVVVVEVDENQHDGYDCSCENRRLMELSQDVGHRPLVMLRFNPDDYVLSDGTVVRSCWGYTKQGLARVKPSKAVEWSGRLARLVERVAFWLNPTHVSERTVVVEQLWFDEQ